MSREILAFSLFAAAGGGFTGLTLWPAISRWLPPLGFVESFVRIPHLTSTLAAATALAGLAGVFCSAMIYIDTQRIFWSRGLTFPKFFGTTLLLGSAATAAILGWTGMPPAIVHDFAFAALLIRTALFIWESNNLLDSLWNKTAPNHRSALIIWGFGRPLAIARAVLFAVSTVFGVLAIHEAGAPGTLCATISLFSTFISQFIERYFFFTAVIAPRMPGPPSSNLHA
jgi:DMSO reductase anchor subunit